MMLSLCKRVWQVHTKLYILSAYDPATALLGIYPNALKIMFTQKSALRYL